jgi:hypothetical protein
VLSVARIGLCYIVHDGVSSECTYHHTHLWTSSDLNKSLKVLSEENDYILHAIDKAVLEFVDPFSKEESQSFFNFFDEYWIGLSLIVEIED